MTEKVQIVTDGTNDKNATFVIDDEDHTLGNAIRFALANNPAVDFVGYSVPHPSVRNIKVRIQTYPKSNSSAKEVMRQGLTDLAKLSSLLLTTFDECEIPE